MGHSKKTGANPVSQICKELIKNSKPLSQQELAAERAAWQEQELKVDHFDRIIK
mgnify:CR=1 FL=1|tara:strand:+ start:79 stop:240 length:162 start_codon:yes stop_codon:yes gene_type:complete